MTVTMNLDELQIGDLVIVEADEVRYDPMRVESIRWSGVPPVQRLRLRGEGFVVAIAVSTIDRIEAVEFAP